MTKRTAGLLFFLLNSVIFILVTTSNCSLTSHKDFHTYIALKRDNLSQSSLLVLNFQEPDHAAGMGSYTAERFHLHLLQSRKFKIVNLYTSSPWHRLGHTEEEQINYAIEEAQDKHFQYVLLGEIKEYFDGHITPSRVTLKTRIIEVNTRTTILLIEHRQSNTGKDPSYPVSTNLSKRSTPPAILIDQMAHTLVKKIPLPPKHSYPN